VKYLCSKNRHAQEVIESKWHERLSHSKAVLKYLSELIDQQEHVYIGHIKISLSTVHNCCNKEKNVAATCRTRSAIGQ